jgi:hypothetical protein
LAVVLDDMRQSVAASGDEGLIMRVFTAGIRLMLLSILDMLIDLLADFRAGRLPPVLPAEDEPACRVGFQPTIATTCEPPNELHAAAACVLRSGRSVLAPHPRAARQRVLRRLGGRSRAPRRPGATPADPPSRTRAAPHHRASVSRPALARSKIRTFGRAA